MNINEQKRKIELAEREIDSAKHSLYELGKMKDLIDKRISEIEYILKCQRENIQDIHRAAFKELSEPVTPEARVPVDMTVNDAGPDKKD